MAPFKDFSVKSIAIPLFVVVSLMSSVHALTISPARIEVTANPGEVSQGEFLLINEQDGEQTYFTSVENFEAQGESGTPSFSPIKEGLASWVQITDKVVLKKGERVKIPFTINVPEGADPGGHFSAIFLSNVPPSTTGNEVSIGAKVGTLILLKVTGDIKEGGGIVSFGLKDNIRFLNTLPATFVYRFSNSGNDRVNPVGNISIRNTIGLETELLNANPSVGNILPNSTRRFDVTWGGEALPTNSSFVNTLRYQMKNFAFGLYFGNLDVTYGSSGSASESTMFFVFPWQLALVSLVVIIIGFILLKNMVGRYNRYIIKQARLSSRG